MKCERCNKEVKPYDSIKRIMKSEYGIKTYIRVVRYKCIGCGHVFRLIPDNLLPYKHYEKRIIKLALEGKITPDIIEYEDYPSEITIKRWIDEYGNNDI